MSADDVLKLLLVHELCGDLLVLFHPVDEETLQRLQKDARARTVNLELEGIKTMLNLAIKWDYLKDNPMKRVKPLKVDDKKPLRFLPQEECERFLEACSKHLYPAYFTS